MSLPFSQEQLNSYLSTLAYRESSNKADAVNSYGYSGLWQMGAMALEDAGLIKPGRSKMGNKALDNPDNWTIPGGKAEFLSNRDLQRQAVEAYTKRNYNALKNRGLIDSSSDPAKVSSLLAQAHLVGAGGVGRRTHDAYGTSTEEYARLGAEAMMIPVSLSAGGLVKDFTQKTLEGTWLPDPSTVADPSNLEAVAVQSYLQKPQDSTVVPSFITGIDNGAGGIGLVDTNQINLPRTASVFSAPIGSLNSGSWDAFSAGFSREVLPKLKAMYYGIDKYLQEEDPNYNPYNDIKGTKYEEYGDWFTGSPNQIYTEKLKSRLDALSLQGKKYSEGGWSAIAGQFVGSLMDPLTLFPIMGTVKGASIAQNAARVATGSAVSVGINEFAYHTYDPSRTMSESEFNVITAGAMGALFGGIGAALSKRSQSITVSAAEKLSTPLEHISVPPKTTNDLMTSLAGDLHLSDTVDEFTQNVVANEVKEGSFKFDDGVDSFSVKSTNPVFGAAFKGFSQISPVLRVLNSSSNKAKQLLQDLVPTYLRTEREFSGGARVLSAADELRGEMTKVTRTMSEINDNFSLFKKGGGSMTKAQFYENVIKNVRKNVLSDNAYVNAAVNSVKSYYNTMLDKLIKQGLLPEDFKNQIANGPGYFTRLWDFDKIHANPQRFKETIANAVRMQSPELADAEVNTVTRQMIDSFITGETTSLYKQSIYKAGELKQKILDLPDEAISDFTINDIREVLHRYGTDVNRELILKSRYGDTTLKNQLTDIIKEYDERITSAASDKIASKLIKERDDMIRDLEAVRDQFLGRYAQPSGPGWARVENGIKTLNTVAYLGSAVVYSVVDAMKLIGVARLSNIPLFKQIYKNMDKMFTDIKLSKEEYRYLGVALDQMLAERGLAISTGSDILSNGTRFDRFIRSVNDNFFMINGMSFVDNALKKLDISVNASNIINDIIKHKAGKLSESRLLDLRRFGIDDAQADVILGLFEKHKSTIDGVTFPNLHKWGEAGMPFVSKLLKAVDDVIAAPSIGEVPLVLKRTGLGRMVGQFRGYMFGQLHKAFLPMLQDIAGMGTTNSMVMASRAISSMLMGSLVYMALQKLDGKPTETDIKKLMLEGIDRGGLLPILSDVSHILDDYGAGMSSWLGVTPISRLKDVSTTQKLLGPSARFVDTLLPAIGRVATGNAGPDEYKAITRAAPGFNLLLWRHWTSQLAQSIGENRP